MTLRLWPGAEPRGSRTGPVRVVFSRNPTADPPMPPSFVTELFPEVSPHLVALLRSISPGEWQRPTVSSRRTVKDIASHLLGGSLRRLSLQRDGYTPPGGAVGPR